MKQVTLKQLARMRKYSAMNKEFTKAMKLQCIDLLIVDLQSNLKGSWFLCDIAGHHNIINGFAIRRWREVFPEMYRSLNRRRNKIVSDYLNSTVDDDYDRFNTIYTRGAFLPDDRETRIKFLLKLRSKIKNS